MLVMANVVQKAGTYVQSRSACNRMGLAGLATTRKRHLQFAQPMFHLNFTVEQLRCVHLHNSLGGAALLRLTRCASGTLAPQSLCLTFSIRRMEPCFTTGWSHHWLFWVHMAPVCGTCSRARQIKNGGPRALRSDEFPMGLPDLTAADKQRVELANCMFWETYMLFGHCVSLGILATLENPSRNLFWETVPFKNLLEIYEILFSNTQMCMMGDLVQNGQNWQQSEMDVKCDNSHTHLPCRKTLNDEGKEVYATSLEAQYPRKFCYSLVQCIIRHLQRLNMQILPDSLFDVKDEKAFEMQTARITAQSQSRRSKLPPIMMWPPLQVSMSNSRQIIPFHCRASWISR